MWKLRRVSSGLINNVKIRENSQLSNPLGEGNALLGHTRHDSGAAFEMLMRQWREGAPQRDPWIIAEKNQKGCFITIHHILSQFSNKFNNGGGLLSSVLLFCLFLPLSSNPILFVCFVFQHIDPLPPVDHSEIDYASFTKNFFSEQDEIKALTIEQVNDLRLKLGIRVSICSYIYIVTWIEFWCQDIWHYQDFTSTIGLHLSYHICFYFYQYFFNPNHN